MCACTISEPTSAAVAKGRDRRRTERVTLADPVSVPPAMDTIHIEGLRVDALVGVYAHEREGTQPLLFDLTLAFDNRTPAASDDVADALDYAAVCEAVRAHVAARRDQLLETLLESLAARVLAQFPQARELRIRVHKPEAARALGCAGVGVSITRGRRG